MLIFTQIIILLLVKFSDGRTNHDLKDFQLHAEQEAWEKANKTPEENNYNEVKDGEGDNTQEADNDDTKKSSEDNERRRDHEDDVIGDHVDPALEPLVSDGSH